jgi:hypothetical protein
MKLVKNAIFSEVSSGVPLLLMYVGLNEIVRSTIEKTLYLTQLRYYKNFFCCTSTLMFPEECRWPWIEQRMSFGHYYDAVREKEISVLPIDWEGKSFIVI